ncbi:MAG: hypothetical protein JWN98_2115 [Abditibacteriota bacterium]|nr:hypothetical protein [Abditibacteriota bacterium]
MSGGEASPKRLSSTLATDTELGDHIAVTLDILILHIAQHAATLTNQAQQAQSRSVIFAMCFQMLGQLVDARRHQRDLHFGRTGVGFVLGVFSYGRLFGAFCYSHRLIFIPI